MDTLLLGPDNVSFEIVKFGNSFSYLAIRCIASPARTSSYYAFS